MPRQKSTRPAKRLSDPKPDDFDKLRLHFLEGKQLRSDRLVKLAKNMRAIWTLHCGGFSRAEVVDHMVKEGICSQRNAYVVIGKCRQLFGIDLFEATRKGDQAIAANMFLESYRMAKTQKDPLTMLAAAKEYAKILGEYAKDASLINLYEKLMMPNVTYTSDPRAAGMEEGEFEDVTHEGQRALPEPQSEESSRE